MKFGCSGWKSKHITPLSVSQTYLAHDKVNEVLNTRKILLSPAFTHRTEPFRTRLKVGEWGGGGGRARWLLKDNLREKPWEWDIRSPPPPPPPHQALWAAQHSELEKTKVQQMLKTRKTLDSILFKGSKMNVGLTLVKGSHNFFLY